MKKILLTPLLLLLLGLMAISQPTISQVSETAKMDVIEASNKQEIRSLALDQNGVKVFFVETSENEKRFLTILFKNTRIII